MMFAAGVGTDLFRAVLQGTPPGVVYALIAVGFVLTYKTSGVTPEGIVPDGAVLALVGAIVVQLRGGTIGREPVA